MTNANTSTYEAAYACRLAGWAGFILGIALGGFFDGIVLHQVLQWHHLLSALEQGAFGDLRTQILADGLFHAVMYILGLVGLYLLFRLRRRLDTSDAGRRVSVFALYGFAAWHILDAVFSHWVLGIHRIRMAADNPMVWDLGWLFIFGLIPLFWAWRLHRASDASGGQGGLPSHTISVLWALSVSMAGLLSLWPVRALGTDTLVVILRTDTAPAKLFEGMEQAGASLLWSDAAGGVWVLKRPESIRPTFFYQYGALYVSGAGMATGCIDWFRL